VRNVLIIKVILLYSIYEEKEAGVKPSVFITAADM
jgi:hypothetical protein